MMNWVARNYKPQFVWRRLKAFFMNMAGTDKVEKAVEEQRRKALKRKNDEFEARRRERLRRGL